MAVTPAQQDKVRQIKGRASVLSANLESHTGDYIVHAEMFATGRNREYRINADGSAESRNVYEYEE